MKNFEACESCNAVGGLVSQWYDRAEVGNFGVGRGAWLGGTTLLVLAILWQSWMELHR
jgi:hypothetical protein